MRSKFIYILCSVFISSCFNTEKKKSDHSDIGDEKYKVISDDVLNSIHVCTEMPGNPDSIKVGRKQAAGKRWLFWEKSKKQLYVAFLDGDKSVQEKVKQVAKEWENYCGKEFVFTNNNPQSAKIDITISFKDKATWSLIGKDCKSSVPSMNLGWLTDSTRDEEYRRVVLHEFGHALGLVHEHQNPNNNPIQWNKENVYAFYKQKFGWTKSTTYYNFFEKYTINQMNSSSFDPKSIMLYEIPAFFTTNGFHSTANAQLSATDKKWISSIYPK